MAADSPGVAHAASLAARRTVVCSGLCRTAEDKAPAGGSTVRWVVVRAAPHKAAPGGSRRRYVVRRTEQAPAGGCHLPPTGNCVLQGCSPGSPSASWQG